MTDAQRRGREQRREPIIIDVPAPAGADQLLTLAELDEAINRGERDPAEAVARMKDTVVYPRFLGMDNTGSYAWELADGRWTWGYDPDEVQRKAEIRTFEPERYVEKYGVPTPILRSNLR